MTERETLRHFATKIVGLELLPGQERFISLVDENFERLRVVVVRKGRRVGMTACAGLLAAWAGTFLAPQFRRHLMPGEDFVVTLVATSKDQAGVLLGFVRLFFQESAMLKEQVVSETANSVTLATGCIIEAVPCSARANRGRANGLVVLDEGAHLVDSLGNSSLRAVLDALTPPLAQFGWLGLMVVISTPLEATGAFHELDQQAASGQFNDMAALHLPTVDARPDLAAEAERLRARNPRQFVRECLGEYTSGDEAFPLDVFDACVDPGYRPPYADPTRAVVLALDGAVSRDSMALVGVDEEWNLVYAREWRPRSGGTIDHPEVMAELLALARRFRVGVVAYDPSQIHGLVLEGLDAGLPMMAVSQAGGAWGGTMARHTSALLESLHEKRLRLFPCTELREHVARARFTARAGADRLTKSKSSDRIDLAVALAMAVGVLTDKWLEFLRNYEEVEYVSIPAAEIARDYAQIRCDFYATLAAEAAEAGDFARARDLLDSLDD
jgi:hypothetical protein